MDRPAAEPGWTVLVREDRIAAVGPRHEVQIPSSARIIDGTNRFVTPGLVDSHVHFTTDGLTRPEFGDGPLYLAYGITTVFNLRGVPAHLEWRRRVHEGQLVGPTIYTAGEFINEPRVNTPAEVRDLVANDRRAGYDLLKYHPVMDPTGMGFATTTGLRDDAYRALHEAASEAAMPLIGHAPHGLGLDALLQANGALAHVGEFTPFYFLPLRDLAGPLAMTGIGFGLLVMLMATRLAAAVHRQRHGAPPPPPPVTRITILAAAALAAALVATICFLLLLPGGGFVDSVVIRRSFIAAALLLAGTAALTGAGARAAWREPTAGRSLRVQAVVAGGSTAALALAVVGVWLPMSWRTTEPGIDALAGRVAAAGLWVQSTLSVYALLEMTPDDALRLLEEEPAFRYLRPEARAAWRAMAEQWPLEGPVRPRRYKAFACRVAGALHRRGVPLMAGTDAMGGPLIPPGPSLHYELQLLRESGLTPFEVIRTATRNPAVFLRQEREFGAIVPGARADLLLLEGNPLADLAALKQPVGVMARGRWFTRAQLDALLDRLAAAGR